MMMSKIAMTIPFALAAVTTTAVAESLPETSSGVAEVAADTNLDWSGHYAGAFVGYGGGHYRQGVPPLNQAGVKVSLDDALGGFRYGYKWQKSNLVYGFDLSISSGIDGSTPQGTAGPYWSCNTGACNVSINSLKWSQFFGQFCSVSKVYRV
ncbi:hypothetical protein [Tritonibacter mobilis]|uniref:hypothetical protein n=1 Tax=Tritonibacter mobilis TaxID=379347 RepID=UPI000E0DAE95|nr:hypothetical protein [Tritonibacter mobilis]